MVAKFNQILKVMKIAALFVSIVFLMLDCSNSPEYKNNYAENQNNTGTNTGSENVGCPNVNYPDWETSPYVLPYPVGKTYRTDLSQCSGSYHGAGEADQFATDFNMGFGTIITASRAGTVVQVEESGHDYEFPNNLVVIEHDDGTFAQYMHLTKNGDLVEIGAVVSKGDTIGLSGATGLAGYPHLHFVVTLPGSWQYPYESTPHNFNNTDPNPRGLKKNTAYKAYPY